MMQSYKKNFCRFARCCVGGLLLVLALPAWAEYVVVAVDGVAGVRKGEVLTHEQAIVIPEKGMLRLIGRDARPLLLTGPATGTVGALAGVAGTARIDRSMLARLSTIVTQALVIRGSGDGHDDTDFLSIDLLAPGNQCALGGVLRFRPPHSAGVAAIELAEVAGPGRTGFTWDAAVPSVAWPEQLAPHDGVLYEAAVTALLRSGRLRRQAAQFTLRLLPAVDPVDVGAALPALMQAGCNGQVQRLLQALVDGGAK